MAVGLVPPATVSPVRGVRLGAADYGSRREPGNDVALIELAPGSRTAAVFTRSAFAAAPVLVARQHLGRCAPRYFLVNAGNANAATGARGCEDAVACCDAVAGRAGCVADEVLPFSTGVIGEPLRVEAISAAVPRAFESLSADGWLDAARAMMTTDTVPKAFSRRFEVGGVEATVAGIAKGSGMIRPDMATMLAFLATDAAVAPEALELCLDRAVNATFNRVTVDGDTSTNDACVLAATGGVEGARITQAEGDDFEALLAAVTEVAAWLAQAIVRDAEGATKFVTVRVCEGRNEAECLDVAYSIAHSPLVKTALFASDANWGRIAMAVGKAGVANLDIDRVHIDLGPVRIVEGGARAPGYREADGQRVVSEPEVEITVSLGRGQHAQTVWTCDFSHDYVKINAEYRT